MSNPAPASEPSLAANLRFAASFLPSVSQLCRDVGLNRQQMNKYLNGGSRPSPLTFAASPAISGSSPRSWRSLPSASPRSGAIAGQFPSGRWTGCGCRGRSAMPSSGPRQGPSGFLGSYHCCINSHSWPGHVLRYVMRLSRVGGWIATKSVGRYAAEPESGQRYLMKCAGVATMQANLLMIVEQQLLGAGTLSTTILQPTYRPMSGC